MLLLWPLPGIILVCRNNQSMNENMTKRIKNGSVKELKERSQLHTYVRWALTEHLNLSHVTVSKFEMHPLG